VGDVRLEKWADLLVNYSIAAKPGERVLLRGDMLAEPLIKAVYAKILEAGAFPFIYIDIPGTREIFYKLANDSQLAYVPEPLKLAYSTFECMVRIIADENTRALNHVDPSKVKKNTQALRTLQEIYMNRAACGELRWTLTAYPTQAYAQDADMSLEEYSQFVFGAVMPDANDPVGYWRRISARQERIVNWLKGKRNVHLVGKAPICISASKEENSSIAIARRTSRMVKSLPGRSRTASRVMSLFRTRQSIKVGK